MRLAFVLFDGMTALDFVGAFDALTRLRTMDLRADVCWELCAVGARVTATAGLSMEATRVAEPLDGYDVVIVPGGASTRRLVEDAAFVRWIASARSVDLVASVCTGSLLLGAAGLLAGLPATTHPGAYDLLARYTTDVRRDRIVDAGRIVTARGVTAAIDLGLHLCERLAGAAARERIREQMDYASTALPR